MKKIVSVLLIVLMLAMQMSTFVFAAGATGKITASKGEITPDETVQISFVLEGNTKNVGSAQFTLFYDNEAFEYVSNSHKSDYFDTFKPTVNTDSTVRFAMFEGESSAASGKIVTVSFKPTAKASVGQTYEFAIGSKGRTQLLVSEYVDGDIISGPDSSSGEKVYKVNVKIIAKPVTKIYTVKYSDGSGKELYFKTQTYQVESGKSTPAFSGTPSRSGYTFKKWSPSVSSKVDKDVEYVATWEKQEETVSIRYTDGVDGETVFADQVYNVVPNTPTPPFDGTPTRNGYRFMGWSPMLASTASADTTYTATWEEIQETEYYTVKYTDGSGEELYFKNQLYSVPSGGVAPLFQGVPMRDGYRFVKWSVAENTSIERDTEIVAIWEKTETVTFTVTYTDGVEGEVVFNDRIYFVEAGADTPEFNGTPKRDGYTFKGWNPTVMEKVEGSITYTATWEKISEAEPAEKCDFFHICFWFIVAMAELAVIVVLIIVIIRKSKKNDNKEENENTDELDA